MPAKKLSPEQLSDAKRLKSTFEKWQAERRANGHQYSQQWVAEHLPSSAGDSIGQSALSQYLNGKIPLNVAILGHFCRLLKVEPAAISPRLVNQEAARPLLRSAQAPIQPAYGAASSHKSSEATMAGRPRHIHPAPVIGVAKLGGDGFYECQLEPDGYVDSYSADPEVYALRVKGDSMHPAIRHGSFVVMEPRGRCVVGEYVAVALRDGRKMVKELVYDRPAEIVLLSVNGDHRMTIDRSDIETMHPVAAIIPASKWRPEP